MRGAKHRQAARLRDEIEASERRKKEQDENQITNGPEASRPFLLGAVLSLSPCLTNQSRCVLELWLSTFIWTPPRYPYKGQKALADNQKKQIMRYIFKYHAIVYDTPARSWVGWQKPSPLSAYALPLQPFRLALPLPCSSTSLFCISLARPDPGHHDRELTMMF